MYERYLLKHSLKLIYEMYVYSTFRPRNVEYPRNVDYTVRFRPILRFVAHIYVHFFSVMGKQSEACGNFVAFLKYTPTLHST